MVDVHKREWFVKKNRAQDMRVFYEIRIRNGYFRKNSSTGSPLMSPRKTADRFKN